MDKQCPKCKSSKIRKFGTVKTSGQKRKQRWSCYFCGATFY